MSFENVRNCLTCEFGFDNDQYDEEHNPFHPERLIITCAGSNDFYGKEVNHNFCCEYWSESFSEFVRVRKKIPYDIHYKNLLDLIKE